MTIQTDYEQWLHHQILKTHHFKLALVMSGSMGAGFMIGIGLFIKVFYPYVFWMGIITSIINLRNGISLYKDIIGHFNDMLKTIHTKLQEEQP